MCPKSQDKNEQVKTKKANVICVITHQTYHAPNSIENLLQVFHVFWLLKSFVMYFTHALCHFYVKKNIFLNKKWATHNQHESKKHDLIIVSIFSSKLRF